MPRWLADEHRLADVDAALGRYKEAGMIPPSEWLEERRDLVRSLLQHRPTDAAMAQPEPAELPQGYIDPEHRGRDRQMLETFYLACRAEGGTADEIHLRGLKAVLAEARYGTTLTPIPVSERPWERGNWCNKDGECWWCPPDGPVHWSLVEPALVYGGWLLPSDALPLPAAPGEGE
jgi:hypothetical protein